MRFLEEEAGPPNLARIRERCESIQPVTRVSSEPDYTRDVGPYADLDAFLWMRYWPAPVPEGELRERHIAAFARLGLEPYWPAASGAIDFAR